MNLTAKFASSIGLLSMLCLMLPGSLRAQTVETYQGTSYTSCTGTYNCTVDPAVTVTIGISPYVSVDSLPPGTIIGQSGQSGTIITELNFCSGTGFCIQPDSYPFWTGWSVDIGTDATGLITSWGMTIALYNYNPNTIYTNNPILEQITTLSDPLDSSFDATGSGYSNIPGTWTCATCTTTPAPTPEPATGVLMLTGLGLLGLVMVMRKRIHLGHQQAT
jgi:PEP-CTERM motif